MANITVNPSDASPTYSDNNRYIFTAGIHSKNRSIDTSGLDNVIFELQPGCIWDGGDELTGWTSDSGDWYKDYSLTISKQDTESSYTLATNPNYPRAGHSVLLLFDDEPLRHVDDLADVTTGTYFLDYSAEDTTSATIERVYIGDDPTGHTVKITYTDKAMYGSGNDITITGTGIIRNYRSPFKDGVLDLEAVTRCKIEHITLRNFPDEGIRIGTSFWLDDIHFQNAGRLGIKGLEDHFTAHRCTFENINVQRVNGGWEAGAHKMVRGTYGRTLFCKAKNLNDANGFWYDIDNNYSVVAHSYVENAGVNGIHMEISFNQMVIGNYIYWPGLNHASDVLTFMRFAGILLTSCQALNATDYGNIIRDNKVFLDANSGHGITAPQFDRGDSPIYTVEYINKDGIIKNNEIFDGGADGATVGRRIAHEAGQYDVVYSNNEYHQLSTGLEKYWNGTGGDVTINFTAWQALPNDSGSTEDDDLDAGWDTEIDWKTLNPTYKEILESFPAVLRYFAMDEPSGTQMTDYSPFASHGTYTAATLNQTGIGDGHSAAQFTSTGSVASSFYNADFNTAFNRDRHTISGWFKVTSSGVWTNATTEHWLRIGNTGSGVGNYLLSWRKSSTSNRIEFQLYHGETNFTSNITISSTDWIHVMTVVDFSTLTARHWVNGTLVATHTLVNSGSGDAIASRATIGSQQATSTGANVLVSNVIILDMAADAWERDLLRYWNRPPAIHAIQNRSEDEYDTITPFSVAITHPGTDTVSYSATGLPTGISLNSSTGEFSGDLEEFGEFDVVVTATDNGTPAMSDTISFVWTVNDVSPVITDPGNQNATENSAFSLDINATDPAGGGLTWTNEEDALPAGLSLASSTGIISGTPDFTSAGVYNITIRATDIDDSYDETSFTITVANTNRAPVLTNPGTQNSSEGDVINLQLSATDADSNSLTYSLESGAFPPGVSINSSGLISGTIAFNGSASSPYNPVVRVTDNGTPSALHDDETFTWNVTNVVSLIIDPGAQTNGEGAFVNLDLNASPVTTSLTWTVESGDLPDGLSINSSTGVISGTISVGAAASSPFSATIRATDSFSSFDEQVISWTVNASNSAPVLAAIGDQEIDEGDQEVVIVSATDADDDSLSFVVTLDDDDPAPAWVSIVNNNDGTADLVLEPTYDDAGTVSLKVTVSDGITTDFEIFDVVVNDIDTTPVLTDPGDQENDEGDEIELQLSATDILGEGLVFTLQSGSLPDGLAVSVDGLIEGTIDYTAAENSPHTAIIRVINDIAEFDDVTIEWIVNNVNRAPVIEAIVDQSNETGEIIVSLQVEAEDPDEDELEYSATGLPTGLEIDSETGEISGEIDLNAHNASPYTVEITVSDGDLEDSITFEWEIVENNPDNSEIWDTKTEIIIEQIAEVYSYINPINPPYTYEHYKEVIAMLNDIFESKGQI